MPYCPKCKHEFGKEFTVCPDCEIELILSLEENMIPYPMESEESANRILSFLKYSNIKGVETAFSEEAGVHLLIPELLYEKASKLIEIAINVEYNEDISEKESNSKTILAKDTNILYPYQGYNSPNTLINTKQKPYVKSKDKYEDLKSSIFSFIFVGALVLIIFILDFTKIIKLPINRNTIYLIYGCFIAIGIFFLSIAFTSARRAKQLRPLIQEEEQFTTNVLNWFIKSYTCDTIDNAIGKSHPDATEDVKILYRFDYIKQYITKEFDIPDESYLDYLCEEIYNKVYDNIL